MLRAISNLSFNHDVLNLDNHKQADQPSYGSYGR